MTEKPYPEEHYYYHYCAFLAFPRSLHGKCIIELFATMYLKYILSLKEMYTQTKQPHSESKMPRASLEAGLD